MRVFYPKRPVHKVGKITHFAYGIKWVSRTMGAKQNAATSHSTFDLLQFARYQGPYHLNILEGLAQILH